MRDELNVSTSAIEGKQSCDTPGDEAVNKHCDQAGSVKEELTVHWCREDVLEWRHKDATDTVDEIDKSRIAVGTECEEEEPQSKNNDDEPGNIPDNPCSNDAAIGYR